MSKYSSSSIDHQIELLKKYGADWNIEWCYLPENKYHHLVLSAIIIHGRSFVNQEQYMRTSCQITACMIRYKLNIGKWIRHESWFQGTISDLPKYCQMEFSDKDGDDTIMPDEGDVDHVITKLDNVYLDSYWKKYTIKEQTINEVQEYLSKAKCVLTVLQLDAS